MKKLTIVIVTEITAFSVGCAIEKHNQKIGKEEYTPIEALSAGLIIGLIGNRIIKN